MNTTIINTLKQSYESRFGEKPELMVKSPGRINLIGEHTDYNLGFVLPAAVDKGIYMALSPNGKNDCYLYSVDQEEEFVFTIGEYNTKVEQQWYNYILGVVAELGKKGHEVKGFNLVFSGDVPQGAGMSSSAALECATALAMDQLYSLGLEKRELAEISQKSEHNYVGVKCGIMDQFASVMGKEEQVIRLDCKSLEYTYIPLHLKGHTLMLCNSHVSHNLASSEYNVRREQCEEGVAILKKYDSSIESLRDVSITLLDAHKDELSEVVYRRCKYVIEENDRVNKFCDVLQNDDLAAAGEILKEAEKAMKDEYEITCKEIDFLADFANGWNGVKGARMMGGGFGGCIITMVEDDAVEAFKEAIFESYKNEFNLELDFYEVNIGTGSQVIEA